MKDLGKNRIEDDNLENVSGGAMIANNALFDKRTTDVHVSNAIKDDATIVESRLLAGEAKRTETDPLKKKKGNDPFGSNFNAGSGLA